MSFEKREKIATVATSVVTVLGVTACSSSHESYLPHGFSGGCEGSETVYVQNQFTPYGAEVRNSLDQKSHSVGLNGNERLQASGWFDTRSAIYPNNPDGIKGETWFYVPKLKAWVADAAVRGVKTEHAPGDLAKYFVPSQSGKKRSDCELTPNEE